MMNNDPGLGGKMPKHNRIVSLSDGCSKQSGGG